MRTQITDGRGHPQPPRALYQIRQDIHAQLNWYARYGQSSAAAPDIKLLLEAMDFLLDYVEETEAAAARTLAALEGMNPHDQHAKLADSSQASPTGDAT
jgi:hypothetical protein